MAQSEIHVISMLRVVFLAALCASAAAFAPAPSALPSLHRTRAQCSSIAMKSEDDVAADTLAQRRIVVGGLFALLAPLAGLPQGAEAAKSGGRMGGGSFRPKAASPRAAPRAAAPAASRPSVTIINSAPAMPFGGGYGYGRPGLFGFGAWRGRFGRTSLRTCPRESLAASCGVLLWRQSALKSRCLVFAGGGYGFGLTPGQFLGLSAIELAGILCTHPCCPASQLTHPWPRGLH